LTEQPLPLARAQLKTAHGAGGKGLSFPRDYDGKSLLRRGFRMGEAARVIGKRRVVFSLMLRQEDVLRCQELSRSTATNIGHQQYFHGKPAYGPRARRIVRPIVGPGRVNTSCDGAEEWGMSRSGVEGWFRDERDAPAGRADGAFNSPCGSTWACSDSRSVGLLHQFG